ncbi:CoA-transferase family III [Nakamurella panacisegetis]|uniref:CoA-transferase family III n=1 Tax=Nakamurella panacisegetis TaxID=1090615 RepID=A0A1H0MGT6_9ACTN|nr:CoA transferase [Nakamurella panacisegetis]SDO79643.1 CoA-transferase family III [Nakamurella panacisegetis]
MSWIDRTLLDHVWSAVGGTADLTERVQFDGARGIGSRYPVADLAAATIGAAGLALSEFANPGAQVVVDRALAAGWFGMSFRPDGWSLPDPWDSVAGDYRCADGWVRLHTNDPRHRQVALAVIGVADPARRPAARDHVAQVVRGWGARELERAVVQAGGCAAQLRSPEQWRNHHQGMAVAHDLLSSRVFTDIAAVIPETGPATRPLDGLKVLDLTRVLAGPTATRFLAGFGAQVLRIDPPDREEPALEAEMTIGKRCARMDLRVDRDVLLALLAEADVLIHGYRPGAMDHLGLGERELHGARPGLVEVMLDAYGWSGPWRNRRGFDSLVQMSSGIAFPPDGAPDSVPTPLPVQALDHATGYLAATAALRAMCERRRTGLGSVSRVSLARTAMFLQDFKAHPEQGPVEELTPVRTPEQTFWGPGERLAGPLAVGPARMSWSVPAAPLGSAPPEWLS